MRKKCRAKRCKRIIEPELIKIIDGYLLGLKASDAAKATITKYRHILLQFFGIYNKPIQELTCNDVQEWLNTLVNENKSKRTITLYFTVLNNFSKYCLAKGYIKKTFTKRRMRPKVTRSLPKFLDSQDIARLKLYADRLCPRDRVIIFFLLTSGCRRSEAAGLDIEDIDLANRTATVLGKGGKTREVHFSIECALLLKEYLASEMRDNGPLFINRFGNRLSDRAIYRITTKLRKMANLPQNFSPHWLRHTFGREMLSKDADLSFVAAELGHESLNTTRIYTQIPTRKLIAAYNQRMG